MAFMEKLKETAGKAAEKAGSMKDSAKESYGKMKEANEQKKAEKQAYMEAMDKECRENANELINRVVDAYNADNSNLFGTSDKITMAKYIKNYYEMLVLPGSRPNISCLTMKPYIDEKTIRKIKEKSGFDLENDAPEIYIKESGSQDILISHENLAFRYKYEKDKNYWIQGVIPVEKINTFTVEIGEEIASIMINGVKISEIRIKGSYKQDFMSLNHFFKSIIQNDFNIDIDKVDSQIRAKIGEKIYVQVSKYFAEDDEKLLFYAGGIDSLTAVDYIACTNKQLIFVNREMLGATANVKQYYYEDVTGMATIQNSQSNDLLVSVIDTALTSALKICTLQVSVAGSKENINTVYLVEATRIIAIYHEMRKNAKIAASHPAQVVMPDVVEQIQKLSQLKDSGIISEEEFAAKKTDLLSKL